MLAESDDNEEIIARVAALDIGKAELVCCVRLPAPQGRRKRLQEVSAHSTMTRSLTELANRLGATVLGVHHTRKGGSEDFLESASGTNGLMGAADFVMVLTRERNESNALLSITGRDVAEAGYDLVFDEGIWSPNGTGLSDAAQQVQGPRLGPTMRSVLALVNSRDITTQADVAQLLDMEVETAGRYLRRLVDYGLITRTGRGRYSLNSLSDCPFPE